MLLPPLPIVFCAVTPTLSPAEALPAAPTPWLSACIVTEPATPDCAVTVTALVSLTPWPDTVFAVVTLTVSITPPDAEALTPCVVAEPAMAAPDSVPIVTEVVFDSVVP